MRGTMIGLVLLSLCGRGAAQEASARQMCLKKADDRERLACFDAAMRSSAPVVTAEPPASSTKEIVAAPANATAAPTVFKAVDAEDVYVSPGKYEGRGIEPKRMRCFHADKDEYRCVASGAVTLALFAPSIRPEKERENIENDCGEIKKMATSPKCEKTVRLIPLKHGEDITTGYRKRVLVVAPYYEIASAPARGRR